MDSKSFVMKHLVTAVPISQSFLILENSTSKYCEKMLKVIKIKHFDGPLLNIPFNEIIYISLCSGLTLAGCQVPIKLLYHSPSSAGQREKNMTKSSWVKIRTRRDHSPITITGKTDLIWGN